MTLVARICDKAACLSPRLVAGADDDDKPSKHQSRKL